MKNLKLDFVARLQLTALLGVVTGPLSKMSSLQHVWTKTRFTEDEMRQIKTVDKGHNLFVHEAPSKDWGIVEFDLEDSYAKVLLGELEGYQNFRVSDLEWVASVKSQLV